MRKLSFVLAACAAVALAACSGHHSNILPTLSGDRSTMATGPGMSIVQTATITGSLGTTLTTAPANGDLLIAIGFDAKSLLSCASGWTSIRHVSSKYVDEQSCYRIASGDTTAQTPFSGTAADTAGQMWEVTGQAASGFIDAETGAESTGPLSLTLTFAPTNSGDLILGASAINTKLAGITPTGFTMDNSSSPAGATGFSDLAAHEPNAAAGTQSVTWAYTSSTDTHPVTAEMIAIYGTTSSASPSPTPSPTPAPTPTPPPGGGMSLVQTASIVSSLSATMHTQPVNGDLLIAIGFDAKTYVGCASGWTSIRHVWATYVKGQDCYRVASGDTTTETPFAGTAADTAGEIWEITGQAASGFIDAETGAEGGPRTVTLTFAPAHSGDLIVGGSAINTKLTGITPTGFVNDAGYSPAGTTGFSDLAAHEGGAAAGTQSVTWSYNSTTDTHPVTAEMIAIYGSGSTATPTPPPGTDWPTMGYDVKRTGYNPNETKLGVSNVSGVHSIWAYKVPGLIGEPVYAAGVNIGGVATNVLYATASNEQVALNADTGVVLWTHALSTVQYTCSGTTYTFGASGAPALDRSTNRIYVPDGAANVHAFDMSTGAEITGWPVTIASPANLNFIYSAVTYNSANKTLYGETSSTCDISPWYGRVTAINTTNASITNTFYPAQGASGGGIWGFGGASIDPSTGNVYVAAGNGDPTNGGSTTAGYSQQVIALSSTLGTVLGHNYVSGDGDFGATPLLFQPPGCPLLAAAENKSGNFELYNASNISAGPTQVVQMSINTDYADFIGSPAYDPVTNYVYVALPSTFGIYKPGLGAFSITASCTINPTPVWNAQFGVDGATFPDDALRSPISIANGVVYDSDYQSKYTYAFNAATGAQLWSHALNSLGVVGPVVANGHLYTADIGGNITAWSP